MKTEKQMKLCCGWPLYLYACVCTRMLIVLLRAIHSLFQHEQLYVHTGMLFRYLSADIVYANISSNMFKGIISNSYKYMFAQMVRTLYKIFLA